MSLMKMILAKIEAERPPEPPPREWWICSWYEWRGTHPDRRRVCDSPECASGRKCLDLVELGLDGAGKPLPRKQRPQCGARNRQGKPCSVRVEPGKKRCRFHGGMSTGPKTKAGRERIAEAQRKRWAIHRDAKLRTDSASA